jgi:transaldolase/glucose-6-phosphate isomerase
LVFVLSKGQKFTDAVVLGMGGSSLGPEVLAETFPKKSGFPKLHVLDSTDPAQVRAIEKSVDLSKTLFIVSSKSGSTTEPNVMKDYFFARVSETIGAAKAGHRFIAKHLKTCSPSFNPKERDRGGPSPFRPEQTIIA